MRHGKRKGTNLWQQLAAYPAGRETVKELETKLESAREIIHNQIEGARV
jgi:hypothetical protein